MHCKELTTTILSPSPSSCPSRSRFLSLSLSVCLPSIVALSFSLGLSLFLPRSPTSRPFFSLYHLSPSLSLFPPLFVSFSRDVLLPLYHSLTRSLTLRRFLPLYHCPPPPSVSLSLALSTSISALLFLLLLLLLPFLFSFLYRPLAEEGAMGRARYLCIVRERASRDRSRSSTREISFTRGAPSSSPPFFSPLPFFSPESISSAAIF